MHLGPCWSLARLWSHGALADRESSLDGLELMLGMIGRHQFVLCGASTEPGTHTRFPLTQVRRLEGGRSMTGRKTFVTLAPLATMFHVFCRSQGADGAWLAARAWVPRASDGLKVIENWDAMGMRASGSHTLEFRDCFVPDGPVHLRDEWGRWTVPELIHAGAGNLALSSVFLGIAEEATDQVGELVRRSRKAPDDQPLAERHAIQTGIGRIEQHLATASAFLSAPAGPGTTTWPVTPSWRCAWATPTSP